MATKTLTITSEAYERLAAMKENKESFSKVINRLTMRHSLLSLAGALSPGEASELKNSIRENRKALGKRLLKTASLLK